MITSRDQLDAGHAVYTKSLLRLYDLGVLGLSARLIWRCPAARILDLYQRYSTANHLDIGVGTGFFVDRCVWPSKHPRIALMDVNPNCLDVARRRIARYSPEVYRANVLDPVPLSIKKFDSISLSWVLHCLPGTILTKAAVIEHLKALLNPGGVIFGATILNGGVRHNPVSRRFMSVYNARGIFTNLHDDVAGLTKVLAECLHSTKIEVVGSCALFSGRS